MDYDDSRLCIVIGELFKHQRLQRGWSQEAVAKSVGIRGQTLRDIEKGRVSSRMSYILIGLRII